MTRRASRGLAFVLAILASAVVVGCADQFAGEANVVEDPVRSSLRCSTCTAPPKPVYLERVPSPIPCRDYPCPQRSVPYYRPAVPDYGPGERG